VITSTNIRCLFILNSFQLRTFSDSVTKTTTQSSKRNAGTFCFASINKCLRSNNTDSSLDLLINVVAIPLLPERPVLPILCT
ncbi:GSCOCG00005837001-RA-CDS, partial [Cotesia congregata]